MPLTRNSACLGMGQQQQPPPAAAAGTLQFTEITMWTSPAASQFGQQFGFKIRGNSMLQPLGLVVYLVPLHANISASMRSIR